MFSGVSANLNDYLMRAKYEDQSQTLSAKALDKSVGKTIRKHCQRTLARINATTAFPLLAMIDLIVELTKAQCRGFLFIGSTGRASQQKHLAALKTHMRLGRKLLRGVYTSPLGLLSPDLVTRHFVPEKVQRGIIEAGGKYHSAPGNEIQPKSVDELQDIVRKAIAEGKKVTVSGAHFSQSKDTLPTLEAAKAGKSVCINMKKLNGITINPEKKTATVQAGATWGEIQNKANSHGLAVKVMQASNVFSVGGSLGVNCHGWDHRTGTLGETVRSLTILNAKGELQDLDPKKRADRELFGLVVGGHGLFGVIVEVEIDLTQNESLISWGKKIAPKDYVEYFRKEILPNDNHVMHLYRLSLDPTNLLKEGVATTYSRQTAKHKMPGIGVSELEDEPPCGSIFNRILIHVARTFSWCRKEYWKKESAGIIDDVRSSSNAIMRPAINAAFNNSRADAEWLQEYFVKGDELPAFLEKLGNTLMENDVKLLNASVRYVKKDERSAMPYAKGEDHFAVVLFFNQSLAKKEVKKTEKWVREIIDYLAGHEGTFYLPYQHFATPEQFLKSYPQADKIVRAKDRYDPQRVFDNGLYADYLKPVEERVKAEPQISWWRKFI